MDEETAKEILARLERIESKVDTVVVFIAGLQQLADVWMSGGRGKMFAALARMKGGGT